MKIELFLIIYSIAQLKAKKDCDLYTYDYEYQNQVIWHKKDIWSALKSLEKTMQSCKIKPKELLSSTHEQFKIVSPEDCSKSSKNELIAIYKDGNISRKNISAEREVNDCFAMSERINYIEGTWEKGQLDGKVRMNYIPSTKNALVHQLLSGKVIALLFIFLMEKHI